MREFEGEALNLKTVAVGRRPRGGAGVGKANEKTCPRATWPFGALATSAFLVASRPRYHTPNNSPNPC